MEVVAGEAIRHHRPGC